MLNSTNYKDKIKQISYHKSGSSKPIYFVSSNWYYILTIDNVIIKKNTILNEQYKYFFNKSIKKYVIQDQVLLYYSNQDQYQY